MIVIANFFRFSMILLEAYNDNRSSLSAVFDLIRFAEFFVKITINLNVFISKRLTRDVGLDMINKIYAKPKGEKQ